MSTATSRAMAAEMTGCAATAPRDRAVTWVIGILSAALLGWICDQCHNVTTMLLRAGGFCNIPEDLAGGAIWAPRAGRPGSAGRPGTAESGRQADPGHGAGTRGR